MSTTRAGAVLFALRNLCTTTSSLVGLAVNLNGELLASKNIGPIRLMEIVGGGAIAIAGILAVANASTLSSFWSSRRTYHRARGRGRFD